MLFPGCRIRVIESTVKGTTGPIPDSIGFVSGYRAHRHLTELDRVIWLRYGKNGKQRLESGNFTAIAKPGFVTPNLKRRSGRVEIIRGGSVQLMDYMEFLCWAYSILRLKKTDWEFKEMKHLLAQQFEIKLNKYSITPDTLINNPHINSPAGREAMANICRRMRSTYYKMQIVRIRHDIKHLGLVLQKDMKRQGKDKKKDYTPESYAEAVQQGALGATVSNRYRSFFSRFDRDAFLYPRAEHLCKSDEWLVEIVKQYKKHS